MRRHEDLEDRAHSRRDAEKRCLHVAIAAHLASEPDRTLKIARENLERWTSMHGPQPYYTEWLEILESHRAEEIAALLLADDDRGQHLRQTAPFAGVLTESERVAALRES